MYIKSLVLAAAIITATCLSAQKVEMLESGSRESFRGLSVVNDDIVWVSGTGGSVGKSIDGGKTWKFVQVPGFEKKDFRDIEAFSEKTAIVIAIDSPAYILRTTDGGLNWHKVFEANYPGVFLDAVDFYNEKRGVVVGDPVDGRAFIAITKNGGKKWKYLSAKKRPVLEKGEAFFAASGTNISYFNKRQFAFVSGGQLSRLFLKNKIVQLPLLQGKQMTGANSITVKTNQMAVVGGDYENRKIAKGNFTILNRDDSSFKSAVTPPQGYMSCIEFVSEKTLISCGIPGVDISDDGGTNFKRIADQSFHVVQKSKTGKEVYLAGPKGAIAKITW